MIYAVQQKFILAILITSNQIHFIFAGNKSFLLKRICFFLFVFLFTASLYSQQPDTMQPANDSLAVVIDSSAASKDSVLTIADSVIIKQSQAPSLSEKYKQKLNEILNQNTYLNSSSKPVAAINDERKDVSGDGIFYILLFAVAMLGYLRFIYTRYFNNLFRVFFNTSLRQSQLTDQLLQAKQPSMFFNLLFTITGGIYVYLLLRYYNWLPQEKMFSFVACCIGGLLVIYIAKFVILKFTGWVTGYSAASNTYIFIIFLINKILGVLLVPFIIVMAFSNNWIKTPAVVISLLLVGLMFLLRFFRSFGLIQHQLKVSRFHFFLYIVGVEILPLLLIYKGLLVLLGKKL